MNKYTNLRKLFCQSKQDHKFNKKLYDTDIIQVLHERINVLEDRIVVLEAKLEIKPENENEEKEVKKDE